VRSLGLIQHINLVKLIGFCCDRDKRLLVYDHMLNESLDAHLFVGSSHVLLNWDTRYQIAIGVAQGLNYCIRVVTSASYTVISSQKTYFSMLHLFLKSQTLGWPLL
jgi:hypothetical protein